MEIIKEEKGLSSFMETDSEMQLELERELEGTETREHSKPSLFYLECECCNHRRVIAWEGVERRAFALDAL